LAEIIPIEVTSTRELTVALESNETAILINNEEMFWKMEKEMKKSNKGKSKKKVGKVSGWVGLLGALALSGPFGWLVVLASFATAAAAGLTGAAVDKFKEYQLLMDYKEHTIIMIKEKGTNAFKRKQDTIVGVEL